jgi:DNA-binding MarR family transcriptional regulator
MRALRPHLFGAGEDALTPTQYDALDVLVAAGSCRMADLAELLRIDASTVTRTVQGLVSKDLAEQLTDPSDGRVTLVAVTPAGRARYERIREQREVVLEAILSRIDPARREELADLLEELVAAVDDFARERA